MAAAYAFLMSLMHTSERILHPSLQWIRLHRNMIESLLEKVRFLLEFLEDYSHRGNEEMAGLERQIADMAIGAEHVIDSHVLDQILARSTGNEAKSSSSFSQYIHKTMEEMGDLIDNKLMRIKETMGNFEEDRTFIDFSPAVSSRLAPHEENTRVGSDEKLNEIMDTLTGQQSNRQIVAIVGMGGIGKTTLANNVYQHPYVKHHFHIRAWATISQNYIARKIIVEILSETDQSKPESGFSDDDLGERLYKSLCGRRYLIVMDDFWSIEAWDEIKRFFPDNRNGSRIMITTRLANVAAHLSSCRPFEMDFLDADKSWELLKQKVFDLRGCPPELEELGKTIAKNCGGLPLAIVVIGGLLAKSNISTELWKHISDNLNSIINSEDNQKCQKMLSLSYNSLPIHLKPCFLHIASLRGQSKYSIMWIRDLWVAEGFLKLIRGKSLEEAANEYITDLIDRNLIFVRERAVLRELESCGMHDLLKDLWLKEAKKINLYDVIGVQSRDILSERKSICLLRCRQSSLKPKKSMLLHAIDSIGPVSLSRSSDSGLESTLLHVTNSRLLRVLTMSDTILPNEIMQLFNLRHMYFEGHFDPRFPSSIPLFWNLQVLSLRGGSLEPILLPPEIWCLPHLRHLQCLGCVLPDPPPRCDIDKHDSHILANLRTLTIVVFFRCSEDVCTRLPNLKTLRVNYVPLSPGVEWTFFRLHDLVHYFHKLEALILETNSPVSSSKFLSFPLSLKILCLIGCRLPWDDMTVVGSLPNLEQLGLSFYAFEGITWCTMAGHFVRLKYLEIAYTNLLQWRTDKTHFPVLECLHLVDLKLEEFPEDFGGHPTLGKIKVFSCSDSTNSWAEQIRDERESSGDEVFQVIIKY